MRLFVYGTLLSGGRYHQRLASSRLLGAAATASCYTLVDLGEYPALLASGHDAIVGELFEVDAPTLADLDELEGCPDLYTRATIELADGTAAVGYILTHPAELAAHSRIASGSWRRWLNERR